MVPCENLRGEKYTELYIGTKENTLILATDICIVLIIKRLYAKPNGLLVSNGIRNRWNYLKMNKIILVAFLLASCFSTEYYTIYADNKTIKGYTGQAVEVESPFSRAFQLHVVN